ncbi:cyclin-Q-like isoform X2 [Cimex lectularius]|nr:cyclin-Q-like isoform X2 [Cimex lectularius]
MVQYKLSGADSDQKQYEEERCKSCRVDYRFEESNFSAVRFIFECGYKLKATPVTIASAATILHRFFAEVNTSYDRYLIATTALYLSGKLLDDKHRLRDVINVAHHTLHRGSSSLDLKEEYWARRDSVVQAEFLIMRVLRFETKRLMPHTYLLHYLATLRTWIPKGTWDAVPICQASLAFLQDLHHSPTVIEHQVQHLALACIHLAIQTYGVVVPAVKENEYSDWYTHLAKGVTNEIIWKIIDTIIDIYNFKFPK